MNSIWLIIYLTDGTIHLKSFENRKKARAYNRKIKENEKWKDRIEYTHIEEYKHKKKHWL